MKMNILNQLETTWAGKTCLCFDVLESTQEYAKELAKASFVHGTLVVADRQTAGKGRRGRVWQSPKGTTISMSLCLEPKLQVENVAGLTLVMALAVAKGILEVTGEQPEIKWPNDIVIHVIITVNIIVITIIFFLLNFNTMFLFYLLTSSSG